MRNFLILLLFWAFQGSAATQQAEQAWDLYQQTKYKEALRLLAAAETKTGATYALLGKCYYRLEDFKKASEYFEQAVDADPDNSEYYDWLGKAYGRRAEHSSFITAPGYASKARDYFKKAVALDPTNREAISDLFEYYLGAPGFLGGGTDKAAALAERLKDLDPAEYHWSQARLAEKHKDYQTAERQLRLAVKLAPKQVGRLIDLAKFLARRGRYSESDATFREASKVAPDSPKLLFAEASAYIRAKRNLDMARQLLKRYLNASLTPDDPSRKEARELLKKAENG